jgi:AraC-like DNA-binding protein
MEYACDDCSAKVPLSREHLPTAIRDPHPFQTLIPFAAMQTQAWMHDVVALLDVAIGHLRQEQPAHGAILEATSLLRRQIEPQSVEGTTEDGKERLLAWQARKVLDYINGHITSRVLVADLCALVWRSEAHFSRSFRGTVDQAHLCKHFRVVTGETPAAWRREKKAHSSPRAPAVETA